MILDAKKGEDPRPAVMPPVAGMDDNQLKHWWVETLDRGEVANHRAVAAEIRARCEAAGEDAEPSMARRAAPRL